MTRYVDVEKLADIIADKDYIHTACEVLIEIDCMPKEDVAPVIHAHWRLVSLNLWECTNCHYVVDYVNKKSNYCPDCGAKMDEKVETDE